MHRMTWSNSGTSGGSSRGALAVAVAAAAAARIDCYSYLLSSVCSLYVILTCLNKVKQLKLLMVSAQR